MAKIIRDGAIVDDDWTLIDDETPIPDKGDIIVGCTRWQSERDSLTQRSGRIGLLVSPDTEPAEIAGDLKHFDVVAVDIKKFADGRFFSLGRILRSRYGFDRELRVCGHVHPDQVFYMKRVGFNAFQFENPSRLDAAMRGLSTFTIRYQGAEDELPLYRYR